MLTLQIHQTTTHTYTHTHIRTGTRDRTAYCAINAAIEFRQSLGGEDAIMNYNHQLAHEGGKLLVNLWGTRLLGPSSMMSSMITVQVPTDSNSACQTVRSQLCSNDRICVSGSASYNIAGSNIACYWRLSTQVYLELSDFQALGQRTLQLLDALGARRNASQLGFQFSPVL